MSEVDAGFLEVLNSCTGAEGEVDYADDGWKPDDGEYTVFLERFTTGTTDKDGLKHGRGNAIFRIFGGTFEGRTFGEFFWLPSNASKITPGMTNLLRLATCLSGRELRVAEVGEAGQIIADSVGAAFLNVRVFTTTSKKNNKTYTNTRFLSLVDEAIQQPEATAPTA